MGPVRSADDGGSTQTPRRTARRRPRRADRFLGDSQYPCPGLARPGRPGGRRIRGPCPRSCPSLGRCRARGHVPHLTCGRPPHLDPTGRLPGGPPGRPLPRLSTGGCRGASRRPRSSRRRGRDLEWCALLLAALGRQAPHGLSPPRPRTAVAHGPLPRPGPPGFLPRAPDRPALLPEDADRHPFGVLEGLADTRPPPIGARSPRRRAGHPFPLLTRCRPLSNAAGGRSGPPDALEALRRPDPDGCRGPADGPRHPARDPRGGLCRRGTARSHRRTRCRLMGGPARARRRRRTGRRLPAGMGGGERFVQRGLGYDPHRGSRLRDPRRGDADPRPRGCCRTRRVRPARRR